MSAALSLELGVLALGAVALIGVVGLKAGVVMGLLRGAFGARAALPTLWVGVVAAAVGVIVASHPIEEVAARAATYDRASSGWRADDVQAVAEPLGAFFVRNSDDATRARFADLGAVSPSDWRAALPAFIAKSLTDAFKIGFWLLLPLMAVDILVGLVLASGDLPQVPARALSLPLKVLVFITADGWSLLLEGLLTGYR
jgi:flagellar biosynthesis protein FliP